MGPFSDEGVLVSTERGNYHFDPITAKEEVPTSEPHPEAVITIELDSSMALDLENSTSLSPLPHAQFIFYPKLPVEIQRMIWKSYIEDLPPRFVSLSWSLKQILPIHHEPLSICSASRSVFLDMYEPIFASERGRSGPFVRANLNKDVLIFKYDMVVQDYGAYNTMRMREGVAERVKHWGQWAHRPMIFYEGDIPHVVELHGLYSLFPNCETVTILHLPPSFQKPKQFWKINKEKFKSGDYVLKELNRKSAIDKPLNKLKWWKRQWKHNVPLMESYGVAHPERCPKLKQLKVELVYSWAQNQSEE